MQIQWLLVGLLCISCASNSAQISKLKLELSETSITRPAFVKLVARVAKDTTQVEFFEDNVSIGVKSAPFETQLVFTKPEQASHKLSFKTTNAAGKTASSEVVKLEVKIAGKVRFVAPNGLDTNDGLSEAEAFLTIQSAVEATAPGDTVLVLNGTYSQTDYPKDNIVTMRKSGTANAWIALMAYPGHTPKLKSINWSGISVQASYILIQGFTIEGNRDAVTLAYAQSEKENLDNPTTSGGGISVEILYQHPEIRPSHVIIRGNTVYKCSGGGIGSGSADYLTIEDNVVWGNAYYSPYANSGISMYQNWNSDDTTGYKMIVRRNIVYGNQNKIPFIASDPDPAKRVITDGNGIIIDDSRNTQNNSTLGIYKGRTLIENNVVFENGARGLHVYESDHVDIINNTTYQNSFQPETPEGEITAGSASDVRVFNNIMIPRSDRASIARSTDNLTERATQVFKNNMVFGGLGFDADSTLNLIGVDPKLTDIANKNFRPQTNSPVIDAGNSSLAAKDDMNRTARPLGAGIDLGAFEVR